MVGKKIIVIANLKPARFAGVTSDGMLLAATNNACGCQVIFVMIWYRKEQESADAGRNSGKLRKY